MTTWAPLRFDPSAPRFDPPGIRPPTDPGIRTVTRSIDRLLDANPKEWRRDFEKYFGPDRRRDRREALTLTLKASLTRTDFLTGNTYVDGPKSDLGCSIMWLAEHTLCGPDRIREAISDLKTAQIERYDRCPVAIEKGKLAGQTIVRRLPKAQPRKLDNGSYTAEPAIRNYSWDRIGEIFRCSGTIKRLQAKAKAKRKREGRQPPGHRQKLMEAKRAARRNLWRQGLQGRRLSDPEQLGLIVPDVYGRMTARVEGALPTPEQPPVPVDVLMAVQLADARAQIIDEWKAANQRAGGKLPLPSHEQAEREARRRCGLPERQNE